MAFYLRRAGRSHRKINETAVRRYPDNSAKDRGAKDTSAKQGVRMPTVRRDNSANETNVRRSSVRRSGVRMRLQCDRTKLRSDSNRAKPPQLLPSGWSFFLSLSLSVCLSFSLGLYVRVRIRVGSLSPTDRQKTARESRSA